MTACSTHPDILTIFVLALQGNFETIPQRHESESSPELFNAITEQQEIGWNLVQFGFLSKSWQGVQQNWDTNKNLSKKLKRSNRWASTIQQELWKYVSSIWDHRNSIVHGKTIHETQKKQLSKLRKQVQHILQQPPELSANDRPLLDIKNLESQKCSFLRHWLHAVKVAARKEKMRRKSETRITITQYFKRTRQALTKLNTHSRRQTNIVDYMETRRRRQANKSLQTVTEDEDESTEAGDTDIPNLCYTGLCDLRIMAQCELRKIDECNKNDCGMT